MIVLLAVEDAAKVIQPELRAIATNRLELLESEDLLGGGTPSSAVLMEAGDHRSTLSQHLGFDVLAGRYSDCRYHEPGYTPTFEILEDHANLFEIVFVLSDYGDGVVVLVPKLEGVDADLLAMCAMYAVPAREPLS